MNDHWSLLFSTLTETNNGKDFEIQYKYCITNLYAEDLKKTKCILVELWTITKLNRWNHY
jgi:hypothetical protein